jgi:hypothetical protein
LAGGQRRSQKVGFLNVKGAKLVKFSKFVQISKNSIEI